jgi:hypothetical protein
VQALSYIWPLIWAIIAASLVSTVEAGTLASITARFPELGDPPQGEAQWVAKSMRLNGLPMTLKTFHSRLDAAAVLNYYEVWARGRYADQSTKSRNGEWRVLALRSEQYYITIQARTTLGGSHGTIAVSPALARAALKLESHFPRPASMRIVNLQQYEDFGSQSEHISLSSERTPSLEARAFAQLLAREGWQLVREQRAQQATHGYVLEAQKGAEQASITVMPDRAESARTAAVVVWKKP